MLRFTFLALGCLCAFTACTVDAQEADSQSELSPASVTLNADGELVGNAVANVNGEAQPVEAKITILKDGVVVDSIFAQEDGSFAFPSVAPGVYNMYGAAANFAGGAAVTVLPSSAPTSAPLTLGLSSASSAATPDSLRLLAAHVLLLLFLLAVALLDAAADAAAESSAAAVLSAVAVVLSAAESVAAD